MRALKLQKVVLVLLISLLTLYGGWISLSYIGLSSEREKMERRAVELEQLKEKMQGEIQRLSLEKQKAEQANERLKAQIISYLKQQRQISEGWEKDKKSLAEAKEKLVREQEELKKSKEELSRLKKQEQKWKELGSRLDGLEAEKERSERKAKDLEEALEKAALTYQEEQKRQEALFHYNLGVAYTKTGDYASATAEYEKALKIDPDDADAHYNLGIIYDDCNQDAQKAIEHYRRYLELRPDAEDIYEVKAWIERLSSRPLAQKKVDVGPGVKMETPERSDRGGLTDTEGRSRRVTDRAVDELKAKLREETEETARLREAKEALETELAALKGFLAQKDKEIATYQKGLTEAREGATQTARELLSAQEAKRLLEGQLKAKEELLNKADEDKNSLENEVAVLKVKLDQATEKLLSAQETKRILESQLEAEEEAQRRLLAERAHWQEEMEKQRLSQEQSEASLRKKIEELDQRIREAERGKEAIKVGLEAKPFRERKRGGIAEHLYTIGKRYYDRGDYQRAIDEFRKVLWINPSHPGALRYIEKIQEKWKNSATHHFWER